MLAKRRQNAKIPSSIARINVNNLYANHAGMSHAHDNVTSQRRRRGVSAVPYLLFCCQRIRILLFIFKRFCANIKFDLSQDWGGKGILFLRNVLQRILGL